MKQYQTGVLFVHGIQGSPKQFDYLTARIPQCVLIHNLLLPGHGADVGEFRKAKKEQWIKAVREAALEMNKKCENIVFVGHSLGCLLGLLVEQELPVFSAMLLLCCPFFIHPTPHYFHNIVLASLKSIDTDDPFVTATREANSVHARYAASYLFCASPYLELSRVIRLVKNMSSPKLPDQTVFFFSQQDEIVGKKNLAYVRERYSAKTELLKECGHNYFTEEANSHLADILLDFVFFTG